MEKKTYEQPIIELSKFDNEDVITTSDKSFGEKPAGYEGHEFDM